MKALETRSIIYLIYIKSHSLKSSFVAAVVNHVPPAAYQKGANNVKRLFLAALVMSFTIGSACESQAIGKDGKPLAGAAKTSFVKKCKKDACQIKAVGKDGKPLFGAAKNSFMKKCQKGA
jgi:hypothetical protein